MDTKRISGNEQFVELQGLQKSSSRLLLTREALLRLIDRFVTHELTASELQELGDLLEGEPVEYDDESENRVMAQIVFEMATPEANGAIDRDAAVRWREMLRSG